MCLYYSFLINIIRNKFITDKSFPTSTVCLVSCEHDLLVLYLNEFL